MQAGTSQQQSYQQEQGWYQDQTFLQNFNNNSAFNRHQNFPQQHYPRQNYRHQNNWNNKRPHEFVTTSHNGSPEPKMRQIQKRNSAENIHKINIINCSQQYNSNSANAAYQTMPHQHHQKQFDRQNRQQGAPRKKPIQQPQENPVVKIQEERHKDWSEKMALTLNLLSGCKPGEEVQLLLSYLQPVRVTWNKIKEQIHNDLTKFLSPLGVEKVLIFGSTLTGLDFHGSDLDFFIQLKSQPTNEDETRITINRAGKIARCINSDFMIICTIQNARVPLVRLLHRKTKVTCDINFSSRFGYYNSYFIGHVIGYDRRIRDLAVILKLWSKSYKLASQMIVTNYCLMMLMIFYLQNLKQPMLDKIINVQRARKPMFLDAQKKWNFYFNDSIDKTKTNHQSLRELLVGFFDYYRSLNPSEYVVSLLTGSLIKREEFDTHPELEESRKLIASCGLQKLRIDNNDFFHVQDGFELNLNIGIKVKKHVDCFFELMKLSYEKCEELKDRTFAELLVKLFTEIKLPVAQPQSNGGESGKKLKSKKNKKKFEMIIHAIPGDLKVCLRDDNYLNSFVKLYLYGFSHFCFCSNAKIFCHTTIQISS